MVVPYRSSYLPSYDEVYLDDDVLSKAVAGPAPSISDDATKRAEDFAAATSSDIRWGGLWAIITAIFG